MKIKRISLITALTVASVLAGTMLASAQDNKETKKGGRGASVEQRLDQMTQDLKLTDEQKPKVKAVLEDGQKKRAELRDLDQDQRREKGRALMEEQNKKLKEILTADQYKKWEETRQQFRGNRKGDGNEKKAEKKN